MGCCAANDAILGGQYPGNISNLVVAQDETRTPGSTSSSHVFQTPELAQAIILFQNENYSKAAEIFRNFIQDIADEEVGQLDGVGQTEVSLGYYEWFPYRHYKEGIEQGKYVGTPYDALALCYQCLKKDADQTEKGIKWYRDMVDDYPENVGILMGCAHILNNKGFYEEALDYYNRVRDIRPKWMAPLECIAYIYEYKRVIKTKSKEMANRLLELEPNSRVGLFILGRNQPTPDGKIQILTKVTQYHPSYARAFNQIGIIYGGTKKIYLDAISWYQKASQACPEYSSCYNNIGVNHEVMKNYEEAIKWYFRGIEKDKEYKAPHANLLDIFQTLKYSDEQISDLMNQYKVHPDYFYYYCGLGCYDKKKYEKSIQYYNKAYACLSSLNQHIYKIHNSIGITYDQKRENAMAIEYYQKAIDANPKYHSAYYNTAIIYKRQNNTDKAIEWYKKAIEVNPRYSYAYNNLANIYKNQSKYEEAVKYYKKAIQHCSTYTLALANMGVCQLKLSHFRQAFNAMERAKECLPTDNNNLSASNKKFLNQTLEKFDKEGETWRQNGGITNEQRQMLKKLMGEFQSNFKSLYNNQGKEPVSREKVLKKEVLDIVRLTRSDEFQLTSVDKVYDLIKQLFAENEDYFHILPLLFMQYFYKNTMTKKRPVLEVEEELMNITKRLSAKTAASLPQNKSNGNKNNNKKATFKLKHNNNTPSNNKVNLFKKCSYFESYEELYAQIIEVNDTTKESYRDYKELVDHVKKLSYGTLFGIGMKLPKDERHQFKVILRIFEKMFKKELTEDRVKEIIAKIDKKIEEKQEKLKSSKNIELGDVVHDIIETWTGEITEIVRQRKVDQVETKCEVSDLLRAKIMYESVDHLKKAIDGVDEMCNKKGYKMIQMDNRLAKKQTQDVVFKIQIKEAVCQLQLAIKQDESQYHFTHSIYEIQRSPLGCIFGSYIFMSKGFEYPFLENCKDIVSHLKDSKNSQDKQTAQAAKYIVDALSLDTPTTDS